MIAHATRAAIGLVAGFFVSNEAYAFELTHTSTGAELRWSPSAFEYGAVFTLGDPEGERFAAACRAAADTWVIASRLGVEAGWSGPHGAIAETDGSNTIAIVSEWNAAFGDAGRTVAHTELSYDVATGRILEADVFLNGQTFSFTGADGFDAQSVVAHEFGHVLGLAHPCGDPGTRHPSCFSLPESERDRILGAIMAPTLAPGVERRTLGDDDREGLAVHYAGTATGEVPVPLELLRECPGGALVIRGVTPPTLEVSLRRAAGGEVPLEEGWDGADLIVRDPATGLYGALYSVVAPAPCERPGSPGGGCGCTTHRQGSRNGAMLGIVLVAIMLAARRRWRTARSGVLLTVVLALSALGPSDALAFKCSRVGTDFGPSLIWKTRTIEWYADEALFDLYADRATVEEDVRASFQAWEDVPCSDLTLPMAGVFRNLSAGYQQGGDNKNVVVALSTGWPYEQSALAVTTSAYDTRTGEVVDADIEINDEFFDFVRVDETCVPNDGTMDLRNTITHEVGHVIGLDHPPNTPRYQDVTMFASAPPCESKKRTLESDDINGICSIYPTGAPNQQCYPPDGPNFLVVDHDDGYDGCSSVRGGTGAWLLLLLGALMFLRPARWLRRWRDPFPRASTLAPPDR